MRSGRTTTLEQPGPGIGVVGRQGLGLGAVGHVHHVERTARLALAVQDRADQHELGDIGLQVLEMARPGRQAQLQAVGLVHALDGEVHRGPFPHGAPHAGLRFNLPRSAHIIGRDGWERSPARLEPAPLRQSGPLHAAVRGHAAVAGGAGDRRLGAGACLGAGLCPRDWQQGDTVRIMYVHVPAAWMAMGAISDSRSPRSSAWSGAIRSPTSPRPRSRPSAPCSPRSA